MWRDKRYYVYILTNPSRTLYTGITSHLQHRIYQHKTKQFPGFTSKYNINRLVLFRGLRIRPERDRSGEGDKVVDPR